MGTFDDDAPPPADHRALGIALALLAAAALTFAFFSRHWLASTSGEVGFGLRQAIECQSDGDCTTSWTAEVVHDALSSNGPGYSIFPLLGWAVSLLLFVTIIGLVAAAGLAILRKRPALPISPTTLSLIGTMLGLVTACVFAATKPGEAGLVGVSVGFFVFCGGTLCGLLASILLARSIRPVDVDLDADPMKAEDFE